MALVLLACAPDPTRPGDTGAPPDLRAPHLLAADLPPAESGPVTGLRLSPVAGLAPLLRLSWRQHTPGTATLRHRVAGGDWQEAPARWRAAGPAHEVLIGHTFGQVVEATLTVSSADTEWESGPLSLQAPDAPAGLPLPTVEVSVPGGWSPEAPYLLTSTHEEAERWSSTWWAIIIDRGGQVVWSHRSADPEEDEAWVSRHLSLSHDRDAILIDRSTAWTRFDRGASATVAALTLDGTVRHVYATPGLLHPYTALPGGALAWGAIAPDADDHETIEVVERDGTQRTLWSCATLPEGTCGSNTLWWDDGAQRLLFSLWSSETIVEVDASSGAMRRRLGHASGAWGFQRSQDAFWWQHGPTLTDDGTLLVSTRATPVAEETVVREYALDEAGQQLVLVWSAGEGRGHYGAYGGDAWRLPGGTTLHGNGSGGRLTEYAPSGAVVWEARWDDGHRIGQTSWITDLGDLLP